MPIKQGNSRYQIQMLSMDEFISMDNPVRLIDAFVDKIELNKIGITVPDAVEGRSAYPPASLLKLYMYGYMNRIRTSRKLARESERNIEMRWLMEELTPCYKTIADFRKDNPASLKKVFRMFVTFLQHAGLIEGRIIGIDGSKFRAVNSKKNNYNQAKIDRHQEYIAQKAEHYLGELDANDREENQEEELVIRKEQIRKEIQKLQDRKAKYDTLQEQLNTSEELQISTTDADSRALIIHRNIVEVSYNNQTVVDGKHSLIIHYETTNENDAKALFPMAKAAKEIVKEESIVVLADKGYHNGEQINECEKEGITTLVAFREQPTVKHLEEEYLVENFQYDKQTDSYRCPQGETLRTNGNWYYKSNESSRRKRSTGYKVKHYKTPACQGCPIKGQCTKNKKGRLIERSEHQEAVERNNERVRTQKELYGRRQSIVEHPFGTIKRGWGYTYTLLKGLKKVNGEMGLILMMYNFRRSINILGIEKMQKLLEKWDPDYTRIIYNPQNHDLYYPVGKAKTTTLKYCLQRQAA